VNTNNFFFGDKWTEKAPNIPVLPDPYPNVVCANRPDPNPNIICATRPEPGPRAEPGRA
jgi:hypothetical protein